jgi:hypothetical protein
MASKKKAKKAKAKKKAKTKSAAPTAPKVTDVKPLKDPAPVAVESPKKKVDFMQRKAEMEANLKRGASSSMPKPK